MSLSSVKSRKSGSVTQKRKLGLTSDFDAQSNTNQPPPTPSEGLDGPAIERTASSDSDGPPPAPSRKTNGQNPAFDFRITRGTLTHCRNVTGSEIVNTLHKKLSKKDMVKGIELYEKRKKSVLDKLEIELSKLVNKVKYLQGVREKTLPRLYQSEDHLLQMLEKNGFTPHPKKMKTLTIKAGDIYSDPSRPYPVLEEVEATRYAYLTSIPFIYARKETLEELCLERDKLSADVDYLKKSTTPKVLCKKDLKALELKLDELVERYNVRVAAIGLNMPDIPHSWRKYGHALLDYSPYPREYYKCSVRGCPAKKCAERVVDNPDNLLVTYEGDHDHSMGTDHAPSANRKRQAVTRVEDEEEQLLDDDEFLWESCKVGGSTHKVCARARAFYKEKAAEKGEVTNFEDELERCLHHIDSTIE